MRLGSIRLPLVLRDRFAGRQPGLRRRPIAEPLEQRMLLSASLVRDLNLDSASSAPFNFTDVEGTLFFFANDGTHGSELWKSDGSDAGTAMVKDINPGPASSSFVNLGAGPPPAMVAVGDIVYFAASDPTGGEELWRSDGTEAGTYRVKDIRPGLSSSRPRDFADADGTLYFNADDGTHGIEPWRSDGTEAGTALVADIRPGTAGSLARSFVGFAGKTFFTAYTPETGGEVWVTDGTPEGTSVVTDIAPTATSSPPKALLVSGDRLYIAGASGLFKSDGTPGGTTPVAAGEGTVQSLLDVNGRVFFTQGTGFSTDPVTLYAASPSDATATALKTFQSVVSMVRFGDILLLRASADGFGSELWRSDGTPGGTVRLTDINPGAQDSVYGLLAVAGENAYLRVLTRSAGLTLWKTDGTPEGTAPVQGPQFLLGSQNSESDMAAVGGRLFFSASDATVGTEPWVTDGTAGGTHVLHDVNRLTLSSKYGKFVDLNGSLIFGIDNSQLNASASRGELWRTDGTPQGTVKIKTLLGVPSFYGQPFQAARLGDYVYFVDGVQNLELWRTDGTAEGTSKVVGFAGAPAPFSPGNFPIKALRSVGGSLYFEASDGVHGSELWKSDGTAQGTVLVTDLAGPTSSIVLGGMVEYRGQIYFGATSEATGRELYKTDGTPAGTTLVKDINPGPEDSDAGQFTVMGDAMYFVASSPANNRELWKTDGTAEGTVLVRDFYPGTFGGVSTILPLGKYLIVRAISRDDPSEVWGLDTATGTIEPLGDLLAGDNNYANPMHFIQYGDAMYFTASGPSDAVRLWKTDGTLSGTVLVKEVPPAAFQSQLAPYYAELAVAGDTLFFTPTDGPHGRELWRSDGTAEGTRLAQEIMPGPADSDPLPLITMGDALLFAADDGLHGSELWRFDPPAVRSAAYAATPSERKITLAFSEDVGGSLTASDLVVRGTADDGTLSPTGMTYDPATNTAVFDLPALPAGTYRASLAKGDLTDAFGNPMARDYGFDFTVAAAAAVVGRYVFYNNSAFDAAEPAPADGNRVADDFAIAFDKQPLLPGHAASFANVTSYTKGINGVMIDIANLPAGAELTPADFAGTRSPALLSVRRGAGSDQTDRVTLVWDDYTPGSTGAPGIAVANGWLTVIVKANERTGLAEEDAFTFGNLIGESGDASALFAVVNALDLANVRRSLNTDAPITSRVDFNRDGRVNALDLAVVRQNFRHSLTPPPAPTSPARLARVTVEVLSDDDTVPADTR